jgi:hypothetical protein
MASGDLISSATPLILLILLEGGTALMVYPHQFLKTIQNNVLQETTPWLIVATAQKVYSSLSTLMKM